MRLVRITCLLCAVAVILTTTAYAAEPVFSASSLTAKDVNCKKCHTKTPHIIHAQKPVDCVNCHGDKSAVSIPQCTKCHDGPIHKVHAGKVDTQACSYCHKNIASVHNTIMGETVCSHCHSDLINVHGKDSSCQKCHKSPPEIVKPVKSQDMTLVCQDCHAKPSVATIHGEVNDKKGCYNCHKGTSQYKGSEIPHVIHANKVDCNGCHQENGKVVVPQCTKCHDIDPLHAFSKIGKLTAQSGLQCTACHTEEAKPSGTVVAAPPEPTQTPTPAQTMVSTTVETVKTGIAQTPQDTAAVKTGGFEAVLAIAAFMGYAVRKRRA